MRGLSLSETGQMLVKIYLKLIIVQMLIVFVHPANVGLTLQKDCYETNDDITVTATLSASSVQSVEWYYSGDVSGNKIIDSTCSPQGSPTGYPSSMTFKCPSTTQYTILVPVKDITLPVIFGAMFTDNTGTIYHMKAVQASECSSVEKELKKWKTIAIVFIVLFSVCFIGFVVYCIYEKTK